MARSSRRQAALWALAAVMGAAALSAALIWLIPEEPVHDVAAPRPKPSSTKSKAAATERGLVRMPVAGSDGYSMLLSDDGTAWLEDPHGKRRKIAEPGSLPVAGDPAAEYREALQQRQARQPGQLLVLDQGVVEIGAGEVVTWQDGQKVVTRDPAGGSVVYYADGRVERQERPGGVLAPPPADDE